MNPGDWIAAASAALTLIGMVGGALYMRGKLDAHAVEAGKRLDGLGEKIDKLEQARLKDGETHGAQSVLNANAAAAAIEARTAREMAVQGEARLSAHERGCDQRQHAIEARFDKTDARLEHLSAEIRNLALGLADNVRVLPANAKASNG